MTTDTTPTLWALLWYFKGYVYSQNIGIGLGNAQQNVRTVAPYLPSEMSCIHLHLNSQWK